MGQPERKPASEEKTSNKTEPQRPAASTIPSTTTVASTLGDVELDDIELIEIKAFA